MPPALDLAYRAAYLLRVPLFEIPEYHPGPPQTPSLTERNVPFAGLDSLADQIAGTDWKVAALILSERGIYVSLVGSIPHASTAPTIEATVLPIGGAGVPSLANLARARLAGLCTRCWYGDVSYDPAPPSSLPYPWE